jgi:hypothetical protein
VYEKYGTGGGKGKVFFLEDGGGTGELNADCRCEVERARQEDRRITEVVKTTASSEARLSPTN